MGDVDLAASIEFKARFRYDEERLKKINDVISLLKDKDRIYEGIEALNSLAHDDPHIIKNKIYKETALKYQRDGNIQQIILFLEEYIKVCTYCSGDAEKVLNDSNLTHAILEFCRRICNSIGVFSGEFVSIIVKIIGHIGPTTQNIFQCISYIFYGLTSFTYLVKTAYWLANRHKPSPGFNASTDTFFIPKLSSAIINGLVFIAYLSVALILVGVIPMPVGLIALKTGIAYSIAAVGTFLGWVGNNVINTFRAKKEYDDVTNYVEKKLFSTIEDFPEIVKSKQQKYADEKTHRDYGSCMVIGMILLALANLGPLLPILDVSAPFTAKLSAAFMICYALNDIYKITSLIVNKISSFVKKGNCCAQKNDSIDELSSQNLSPTLNSRSRLGSPALIHTKTFVDSLQEEKKRSADTTTPKHSPISTLPLTSPNSIFRPRARTEKNYTASLDERLLRVAKC